VAEMSVVQQLHDIHVPSPVMMWPLAIGWWLLLIGVFLCIGLLYGTRNYWVTSRNKKTLLLALQNIQQQYEQDNNAAHALNALSILLKKSALQYYPRDQVAGLHGEVWFNFLSQTSKEIEIHKVRELFNEKVYQKQIQEDISYGFKMVKEWIEQQRKPCMN
jgi:Domain of unknown function (DUF4381)